jgi:diguanylate cyclase (GGDEF)-like protein
VPPDCPGGQGGTKLGASPHDWEEATASGGAGRAGERDHDASVGTFRWELATRRAECSPEMFAIAGIEPDQCDGSVNGFVDARVHVADVEAVRRAMRAVEEGNPPHSLSFRVMLPNGRMRMLRAQSTLEYDAQGQPVALVGRIVSMGESYSHQAIADARLRLLEYSPTHSLDDLLQRTVDEAETLSGSRIGFYHFVDPDQVNLTLQNWSTRTKAEYCKAEGKGEHYPIEKAGVWVECVRARAPVIHNDYASLPDKKGLPEGHAEVIRELVVPVMRQDAVCAILGVGNKPSDYDGVDVEGVSMLADLAWSVAETKIAQVALERSEERFRRLYETMNDGAVFVGADGMITSSNPVARRMLGLTEQQVAAGAADSELHFFGEDGLPLDARDHPAAVALVTGQPVLGVTVALFDSAEQDWRWLLLSAVPELESGSPTPSEVFVTLTDVTELKRARQSAERANELLTGLRDATTRILSHPGLVGEDITAGIRALAVAFGVDCGYVFLDADARDVVISGQAEMLAWNRPGGSILAPPAQEDQLDMFERWRGSFSAGHVVGFGVSELELGERKKYEARSVFSVLAVPVYFEGRLWGFVSFEASGAPKPWAAEEIETVRAAASRLGATIEFSDRALRDPLTGLYNRRYLAEALAQALARAAREGSPLSVVQFDIDDFKRINDRHGHAIGDTVLRELSRRLREHTRVEDTAARVGGDEFVVVMPSATLESATESAERWRCLVESDSATWGGEGCPRITISAGVSSTASNQTAEGLLALADKAMLQAKKLGRNRVLGTARP